MAKLKAIIEQGGDGTWGGFAPALPGVIGLGSTKEEAIASLEKSVRLWSEAADDWSQFDPIAPVVAEEGQEIVEIAFVLASSKKPSVSAA